MGFLQTIRVWKLLDSSVEGRGAVGGRMVFLCQSTQKGHAPIFRVSLRKAFQFCNGKFNSSPPIFFGKKNPTFLSRKMLCLIEIYISNLTPSTSAINFRHGAQRHWSLHPLRYLPAVVRHRSTRRLTVCCKTPQF